MMGGRGLLVASLVCLLIICGLGWWLTSVKGDLRAEKLAHNGTRQALYDTKVKALEDGLRWEQVAGQQNATIKALREQAQDMTDQQKTASEDCKRQVRAALKATSAPRPDTEREEVADAETRIDLLRYLNSPLR